MFEKPDYGTDCARCPKKSQFGEYRSEHPASTRCQWCLSHLCSLHAEAPFGETNSVRACCDCARRIADAHVRREVRPTIWESFLAGPPAAWAATYGSKTFTGYPPGAR